MSAKDFGGAFKGFLEKVAAQGPTEEAVFVRLLRTHFDTDPTKLPIVAESWSATEHANLQVSLDAWLAGPGRSQELVGVVLGQNFLDVNLVEVLSPGPKSMMGGAAPSEGPVQYANVSLGTERVIACVQRGLYLIKDGERRFAAFQRGPSAMGFNRKVNIDVMARDRAEAERFLAEVRLGMRERNVYRGRTVSLVEGKSDRAEGTQVQFHDLPKIARDQIILPDGLLNRIERETIRFAELVPRLKAALRHLKRGVLLHGPPGTGKTLTAMYLAGQMKERTTILVVGRGLGLIEQSCAMARLLQPSIVIVEDVDLVAEERTSSSCKTGVLFELLNEMDGLADDTDVIFLLTTNRPDILEPALAARPGRVDLAVLVPLPDEACRRRLIELYGKGLVLKLSRLDHLVERTEGVSAAFIRELVRKAALFAADESRRDELVVEDRHMDQALRELMVEGGELTRSFLGFSAAKAKDDKRGEV